MILELDISEHEIEIDHIPAAIEIDVEPPTMVIPVWN